MLSGSFEILDSEDKVSAACELLARHPAVGLDFETTELHPADGRLRLIQLSNDEHTFILDLDKFLGNIPEPVIDVLENGEIVKIIHNAAFEHQWAKATAGININNMFDTYLADLLCSNMSNGIRAAKHGLGQVCHRYIDFELDKNLQGSDWSGALSSEQLRYAARDSQVLLPLHEKLKAKLQHFGLEDIAEIEFDAVPAVSGIELLGYAIDKESLRALYEVLKLRHQEATVTLQGIVRKSGALKQPSLLDGFADKNLGDINLNSNTQIRDAFRNLGVPILIPPKMEDGKIVEENENKLILEYKAKGEPFAIGTSYGEVHPLVTKYPIIEPLLKYRKVQQLLGTNCEPLFETIKNGRIHPKVWQINTETGRMSMSDPNLQQVPVDKEFRECFRPKEGRCLVIADYGQIELRILAHLSQDPTLMKAFREGLDLHAQTQAGIFGYTYEYVVENKKKLPPQDRIFAKTLNFGIPYGMGPESYAQRTSRSLGQAKKDVSAFKQTYSQMTRYLKDTGDDGLKTLMTSTIFGRGWRLNAPKTPEQEGAVRRNAANHPIQGTGADILKLALGRLYRSLDGKDADIVHLVHDEAHVECKIEDAEEVRQIMIDDMLSACKDMIPSVPCTVDAAICQNWSEKA